MGERRLLLVPALWRTLERVAVLVRRSSLWPFRELWSEQAFGIMYGSMEGRETMADDDDVEVGIMAIERRIEILCKHDGGFW